MNKNNKITFHTLSVFTKEQLARTAEPYADIARELMAEGASQDEAIDTISSHMPRYTRGAIKRLVVNG